MKSVLSLLAQPFLWSIEREKSGGLAWSLALADALVCVIIARILGGLWLDRSFDADTLEFLTGGIVLTRLCCLGYSRALGDGFLLQLGKAVVAALLAFALLRAAAPALQFKLEDRTIALILAACLPWQVALRCCHRRLRAEAPLEPLRWTLLAFGGLLLGAPFLTTRPVGTGDAYWYGNMVGDFVTQWRMGIFPVFVGQTDYAFNGAVTPLRFAPYLQHAAGVLDLLTGRTLSPTALLNFLLFLSLTAAAFTAYSCLRAMERSLCWLAFLLALLFASAPGTLALPYTGDLFMSACTLPYLPLVFHGVRRSFSDGSPAGVCFMTAALAAVWLSHPPIAFWLTLIVTLSQLLRLGTEFRRRTTWTGWLAGAAVFVLLAGYVFVSVYTLKLPNLIAEPTLIVRYLHEVFPAVLLPVSEGANALSDYQLGWSLWAVLLAGGVCTLIRPRRFAIVLLLGCLFLLALLMPVPGLLPALWLHLPQQAVNITNHWPMQRFYVLLAAMSVFLGHVFVVEFAADRRWSRWLVGIFLAVALAWSARCASFFVYRGTVITASVPLARLELAPQNRVLTRYAFNPFPSLPPYYTHGYIDPLLENRLLAADSLAEIDSNQRALLGAGATTRAEGPMHARPYGPGSPLYELVPAVPLEPRRHYALLLDFAFSDLVGSFLVGGPTLQREYYLPDSATNLTSPNPPTSFGTTPTSTHAISLWSESPATENVVVQFSANSLASHKDITEFGHYQLREFDPAKLPVAVERLAPYRASTTVTRPAFLETPRLFLAGYSATVNRQPVAVRRSPVGLVMIPLTPGENHVVLTYRGPLLLRMAYGVGLAAWGALLTFLVSRGLLRLVRGSPAAAPQ